MYKNRNYGSFKLKITEIKIWRSQNVKINYKKITLANQLQTLRMFFDEESLVNLRLLLIKNSITEIKNVYFLNQIDEFGKPCYPVVVHISANCGGVHDDIINNTILKKLYMNEFDKTENIEIYLVYLHGKFAYCVPENSKKLDVFLDDLLNKNR